LFYAGRKEKGRDLIVDRPALVAFRSNGETFSDYFAVVLRANKIAKYRAGNAGLTFVVIVWSWLPPLLRDLISRVLAIGQDEYLSCSFAATPPHSNTGTVAPHHHGAGARAYKARYPQFGQRYAVTANGASTLRPHHELLTGWPATHLGTW
jgi:hypothetical protein